MILRRPNLCFHCRQLEMLSTGDVHGYLRKLEKLLRLIKYPGNVDYNGLSKGDPSAFLPIVNFTFTSFSPPFAEQLVAAGLELTGKTDLRFIDTLYKALRDIFHYKPILTKQQFLQWGFSQRKISVICDIIDLVLQRHSQLKKEVFIEARPVRKDTPVLKDSFLGATFNPIAMSYLLQPRVRCPTSHRDGRGEGHPTLTDADTVLEKPFVVNHIENPSSFSKHSSHAEALSSNFVTCTSHDEVHSSSSSENRITEQAEGEEDEDNILHLSEVERRLSAFEAQLECLLSGLDRLSILEKRLEELERWRKTDKNGGQVITISRESWENLMSRVLLLETKVELSNIQLNAPPPCPSPTTSYSSSSTPDASKEELKDKLESITNMLRSTSNLLKNTESSTAACT